MALHNETEENEFSVITFCAGCGLPFHPLFKESVGQADGCAASMTKSGWLVAYYGSCYDGCCFLVDPNALRLSGPDSICDACITRSCGEGTMASCGECRPPDEYQEKWLKQFRAGEGSLDQLVAPWIADEQRAIEQAFPARVPNEKSLEALQQITQELAWANRLTPHA